MPSWDNNGPNRYDYAITGIVGGSPTAIPFMAMPAREYPYTRQTISPRKQQIDTTTEIGEQALQNWWYRSQSSFDYGAGIKFFDTARDETLSRRFADSCGVNVFDEGQITLLRESNRIDLTGDTTYEAGHHQVIGYANAGEEGVLVVSNSSLKKVTAAGAVSTITWGGTDAIFDLTTDGGAWFVVAASGVYRGVLPGGAGTKIYAFETAPNRARIEYLKERLFIMGNNKAWSAAPTPSYLPMTLMNSSTVSNVNQQVPLFYAHGSPDWIWTAGAEGPRAVYASGYSGDLSSIYYSAPNVSGGTVTYESPSVVAQLPPGERVLAMRSYLGTYMLLGTNLGFRVALLGSDGTLQVGPLSVETDGDVNAVHSNGNFAWFGTSNCSGKIGLYKVDLSQPVQANSLLFAWARDIYMNNSTWSSTSEVHGIAPIGYSGRIAFTIDDVGLVFESDATLVSEGWLETGKIRFDTAEDKVFQFLRVNTLASPGSVKIEWRDESATLAQLIGVTSTVGLKAIDTDGSDGDPHSWLSYRFTLYRSATTSIGPTVLSYQVKANPANIVQRGIRVALMCFEREQSGLSKRVVERPVWDRIEALEAAETNGAVVLFQDFNTGEERYALIESVQFNAAPIADHREGRANPGGTLIVTLRAVV